MTSFDRDPPSHSDWRTLCETLEAQAAFGLEWGLDRMREALAEESHPHETYPVAAIAGTNGKGSTAALLAGIAQAHGLEVGLFTSPHLIEMRERYRIDGRLPTRREVYRGAGPILSRYAEGGTGPVQLTYFELTALIAARLFEQRSVDIGIFEVGLGGRLDAVNALDPDLSVITSIDYDHTDILGDTIEAIAAEKAGILRTEAPAVVGPQPQAGALEALRDHLEGTDSLYGSDFELQEESVSLSRGDTVALSPSWTSVQRRNAATALEAASIYLDEIFDVERARAGLRATRWPGRLDIRSLEPGALHLDAGVSVCFDTAHNPGAMEALLEAIRPREMDFDAVVFGAMADKDLEGLIEPLLELGPIWGALLSRDRAANRTELEPLLSKGDLVGIAPLEAALREAAGVAARSGDPGRMLVVGSTFLVGACFESLGLSPESLISYHPTPNRP